MRIITLTTITLMCLLSLPVFLSDRAMAADDVPLMTKEALKENLGSMNVIVIDVRYHTHWNESQFKIEGAIREDPNDVNSWVDTYPKGSTIVFY